VSVGARGAYAFVKLKDGGRMYNVDLTGRSSILKDVTDALPKKTSKGMTQAVVEAIEESIAELAQDT
jgi:hypothetical protein